LDLLFGDFDLIEHLDLLFGDFDLIEHLDLLFGDFDLILGDFDLFEHLDLLFGDFDLFFGELFFIQLYLYLLEVWVRLSEETPVTPALDNIFFISNTVSSDGDFIVYYILYIF